MPVTMSQSRSQSLCFTLTSRQHTQINVHSLLQAGKTAREHLLNAVTTTAVNLDDTPLSKVPNSLCCIYSVSPKKSQPLGDLTFFHFLHKRLRICNRFFTHLLNVPIFARLQIFIQLSPISTKLCHIKRDYPVHIICAKCPKRARSDVCVSR